MSERKTLQQLANEHIESQREFNSPSRGVLTFKEVIFEVGRFMHNNPKSNYHVVIGTDSQQYPDRTDFVSAIIVHRLGSGGIYFWHKLRDEKNHFVLRDRMYQEALMSINLSQRFMEEFKTEGILRFNFEIHVDIGEGGRTREMVTEVIGMVQGSGFEVKTKPQAYGAASVADRHT